MLIAEGTGALKLNQSPSQALSFTPSPLRLRGARRAREESDCWKPVFDFPSGMYIGIKYKSNYHPVAYWLELLTTELSSLG